MSVAEEEFSTPIWARLVKERDGWVCVHCGSNDMVEAHHKFPQVQGGANTLSNGETLCPSCHHKAHTSPPPTEERGVLHVKLNKSTRAKLVGLLWLNNRSVQDFFEELIADLAENPERLEAMPYGIDSRNRKRQSVYPIEK